MASALIGCIIGGALGGYCSNASVVVIHLRLLLSCFLFLVWFCLARTWFYLYKPGQHSACYLAGYVPEFVIYRIIGGIGVV